MIEFGIFDESHTMKGIEKRTGYGLYDTNSPIWYRLFLTATLRNYIDNPKLLTVFATKHNRRDGGQKTMLSSSQSSINDKESQKDQQTPLRVRSF